MTGGAEGERGRGRRLVINADDFGLSAGVNRGILEAHAAGVVTSASPFVNTPGFARAAAAGQALARPGGGARPTTPPAQARHCARW